MMMKENVDTKSRTRPLTIGRLARAADVHVETVRYYERRGLLKNYTDAVVWYRKAVKHGS